MKLNKKHKRILTLLKRNRDDVATIAQKVGMSDEQIWALIRGDTTSNSQELVDLFSEELKKIEKEVDVRVQREMVLTRENLIRRLKSWSESITTEEVGTVSKHKQLIDSINCLQKAAPAVNITNYTWKQGMTMEEALDEFKRLTALARRSVERERVSKSGSRGAAEIPGLDGQVDALTEDAQGIVLHSESETETFPPE